MSQRKQSKTATGDGDGLTVSNVAQLLQVNEETVRRYIRQKRLKAEKKRTKGLLRIWLVQRTEVENFDKE